MTEIEYLNYPTDGTYCRYSTAEYSPTNAHKSYEVQSKYTRKSKPNKYFTDREYCQYDKELYFQGKSLTQIIEQLLEERPQVSLLDVGCGEGYSLNLPQNLISRVYRYGISASDLRSPFKKISDKFTGNIIIIGNAENLSKYFHRDFFDIVISMQALLHMDQIQTLPSIVRVMKPSGIAMLNAGSTILASRIPDVTDVESYEFGVSFRKSK